MGSSTAASRVVCADTRDSPHIKSDVGTGQTRYSTVTSTAGSPGGLPEIGMLKVDPNMSCI